MSFPNRDTDRISILPDSILCHILSFLPTKQSAATSILSKRWKPLWLSVLTLNFDDQGFYNFSTFRHFVYSVMLMRDTALPIRSFRLKCGILRGCDPHDINRFVCAAVKRGIHSLILDLSRTNEDFQIKLDPTISSVFNCRNLVVLKLKSLRVNFRPQFDFPLLKTLHLDSVYFFGPYVRNNILDKLIEECPILEQFQVTDLRFGLPYLNNWGSRDLEHLVRANISDFKWKVPFARVCSAKFLLFELNTDQQVHTFHNLTHMELIFVQSWKEKRKMLLELLQHCPNLQDLTLHKFYRCEIDEHGWSEPQIVPKCLSSQLRTCSLIGYKGTKCELQFAEYILRNSKVLQTMKISAAAENINMKHQMLMKLSLCPRGSIACKLSFD